MAEIGFHLEVVHQETIGFKLVGLSNGKGLIDCDKLELGPRASSQEPSG